MKITIDSKVVEQNGLTMAHFFLLLFANEVNKDPSYKEVKDYAMFLADNNLIFSMIMPTDEGKDFIENVFYQSQKNVEERDFETLICELQDLWPAGYKEGKYRWKSNKTDIKRKLEKFFRVYGNSYTNEQIIEAAKMYVKKFDDTGDRKYQKILKYFIMREVSDIGESGSDLATNLESIINNEDPSQDNYSGQGTLFI